MRTETLASITLSLLMSLTAACNSASSGDSTSGTTDVKAPTNLKAQALEGGAHLTWQDNSDNEAEFMIERKTSTTDWKTVGTVPFNTTQYHDADLMAGMTYMYRVMAMPKQGDKGSYSGEVSFTNPATAAAAVSGAAGRANAANSDGGGGQAAGAAASGGAGAGTVTGGAGATVTGGAGGAAGSGAGHAGSSGAGAAGTVGGAGGAGGAAGGKTAAGASGHDGHHGGSAGTAGG